MEMKSMAVCDLRVIKTVEAAKSIDLIESVALLIMPKDADSELKAVLLSIPKKNIATTMWLNENDRVEAQNGLSYVSEGRLSKEYTTVCLINGTAVIDAIPPEIKVELIVNGMALLHEANRKESGLKVSAINGMSAYVDFDQCITSGDSFEIDAEFLKYAKPKTAVIADDKIEVAEDVTSDMLAEKITHLIAGDSIVCYKAASGFIRANSTCGDGIVVKG